MKESNFYEATPKIYVGTYYKYNNGSIFGEWLELNDYNNINDFYQACKKLHKDENDPEYMFQDWENIEDSFIGESWISKNYFIIMKAREKAKKEKTIIPFGLWLELYEYDIKELFNNSDDLDHDDLYNYFMDSYLGHYEDGADYAYHYYYDNYDMDLEPIKSLSYYLDWVRVWESEFESYNYNDQNGYIFKYWND
jgi:antirestriction protein